MTMVGMLQDHLAYAMMVIMLAPSLDLNPGQACVGKKHGV